VTKNNVTVLDGDNNFNWDTAVDRSNISTKLRAEEMSINLINIGSVQMSMKVANCTEALTLSSC
jgi:hypothetical protein